MNQWIPNGYLYALGWMLVHSLWQIAGLGLVLWLLLKFFKDRSAAFKYHLGTFTLLLMLAGSITTAVISFEKYTPSPETLDSNIEPQLGLAYPIEPFEIMAHHGNDTPQASIYSSIEKRIPILVNLWLVGAILFLIKFGGSIIDLGKLYKSPKNPIGAAWQEILNSCSEKLGIKNGVGLFESSFVNTPLTFGLIKPVILIPAGLIFQLTPSQLEAIIAHELAHIKRQDFLVNFIQSALEVIFFFHPVFWWINGVIRTEREHACDDIAINLGANPKDLANALAISTNYSMEIAPELTLAASSSKNPTLNRIRRIMGLNPTSNKTSTLTSYTMMITLILGATLIFGAHADKPIESSTAQLLTQVQSEVHLSDDFWQNFEINEDFAVQYEQQVPEALKKEMAERLVPVGEALVHLKNSLEAMSRFPKENEGLQKQDTAKLVSQVFLNDTNVSKKLKENTLLNQDSTKSINTVGRVLGTPNLLLKFNQSQPPVAPNVRIGMRGVSAYQFQPIQFAATKDQSEADLQQSKVEQEMNLASVNLHRESMIAEAKLKQEIMISEAKLKQEMAIAEAKLNHEMMVNKAKLNAEITKQNTNLATANSRAVRVNQNNLAKVSGRVQKDSADLIKQLRLEVEKLQKSNSEEEKAAALKKITEITVYLDEYNVGRVQPPMEVGSEAHNRLLLGSAYSTSPNYFESRKLTEAEQKEKKELEEAYKKEFEKYRKELEVFMKEYQTQLNAWQKEQEPLMKAYQEKIAKLEAEAKPFMEEFQQKMNQWMKENEGKFKLYQDRMAELQKEYTIKMKELEARPKN
ncbi:M56 family metallopeptidase [Belliella pelovolcani]|uniref:M56 family metallopeptidase n=1 Tax=Belliella pelovolcani TaxID=529505 RepID=UPI003919B0F2